MHLAEELINQIISLKSSKKLFNPYSDCCLSEDRPDSPKIRRENLFRYFSIQFKKQPEFLWVFEAPGYRGCRRTGLPLVSEDLFQAVSRLLGLQRPFQKATKTEVLVEYSANVVWRIIGELGEVPLIWNAFPLHPFWEGRPLSNCAPRKQEIDSSR